MSKTKSDGAAAPAKKAAPKTASSIANTPAPTPTVSGAPSGGGALNNLTSSLTGANPNLPSIPDSGGAQAAQTVFMGFDSGPLASNPYQPLYPNAVGIQPKPTQSLADALVDYRHWSPDQLKDFAEQLYVYGYIQSPTDYKTALGTWWPAMVKQAAILYSGNNNPVTPWDMIGLWQGNATALKNLKSRQKAGAGAVTQVQPNVDITDPVQAKAAVNVTMRQMLGRDATPAEVSAFTNAIQAKEKANPTVQTTGPAKVVDGKVVTPSTTKEGFSTADVQDYLQSSVQSNPEYGAYQAAAYYLPQLLGLLGVNHGPAAGGPTGRN